MTAEYATLCPSCFEDKGNTTLCPHCGYDEEEQEPSAYSGDTLHCVIFRVSNRGFSYCHLLNSLYLLRQPGGRIPKV